MSRPLSARPVLLFQIRMLNRIATRFIRWGERLRNRAHRLTEDAVRAYRLEMRS